MSGIEIVGLIFGAIPLIVEGFEISEKAFAAFDTYRHYPKELKKLEAKLGAQKTVFRNNCLNLLSSVTNDRQKVYAMLSETSHVAWQDNDIRDTLASRIDALDESFVSCQRTMAQIHESLQNINRETENFHILLRTESGPNSQGMGSREWCRRLGKRIKLSLGKPGIETHIDELRNFNVDFNIMSNQIIKSIKDTEMQKPTASNQVSRALPNLAKYQSVRKASQWLYETLVNRWTCSLHSNHTANISLDDETRLDEKMKFRGLSPSDISTVRLEMAVTYYAGSHANDFPIWLEIESSVDVELMCRAVPTFQKLYDITSNLQSLSIPFVEQSKESSKDSKAMAKAKAKKSVRFNKAPEDEMQTLNLDPPAATNDKVADDPSIDLCLVQDVCEHFQKYKRVSQQQICLGYLNDTCVQRFYQPPAEKCLGGKSKSLADVIEWVSKDPIRILPRPIMIQLASSLATAVLRYHSTPWLSDVWKSGDIVFFGIDDFQQGRISLRHPHLNIEFSKIKGKGKAIEDDASTIASYNTASASVALQNTMQGARNEVLFRLGIVLLEVGFATPWPVLRTSMLETLPDKRISDYRIADKLACLLVNSMGPNYSRIIRKCLGCDFGLGETDLASEELQGKFLLDVVLALKGLEERFPVT